MEIFGVKVDNLDKEIILEKIKVFLASNSFHQIATINPEFVLMAQKDEEFRNILNNCDLNVADGVGIWFAFLRFGKYLKQRMTGVDLMEEILKIASEKNYKIFLAVSDRGLSSYKEIKNAILKRYPALEIDGMDMNVISNFKFQISNQNPISNDSNSKNLKNCEVVFCNFGAPEQEKFLHSLKSLENGKIRLAMGVGGGFDFITGKIKRAPIFMRKLGLEWLWRLVLEPKYRLKRIFNAVIIFPIKVLLNKKENE